MGFTRIVFWITVVLCAFAAMSAIATEEWTTLLWIVSTLGWATACLYADKRAALNALDPRSRNP